MNKYFVFLLYFVFASAASITRAQSTANVDRVHAETDQARLDMQAGGVCAPSSLASDATSDIQKKYTSRIEMLKSEVEADAKKIQDEMPKPGPGEAFINMTFHFRDETADLRFDTPVIVMSDQKISMDLPDISMKTQTWSWDNPTLVGKDSCTPGVPEAVVTTGRCDLPLGGWFSCPQITMRPGKDICSTVPTLEMRRQEIKLDVPELTMHRQEWVVSIPQIKMVTQRIVFTYPALIVDNIEAKSDQMRVKGETLQRSATEKFAILQESMNSEMQEASMQRIVQSFDCQTSSLKKQMRTAYDDLNVMLRASESSFSTASKLGASEEVLKSLAASTTALGDAKVTMLKQYVSARREISQKRREALDEVRRPASLPPNS